MESKKCGDCLHFDDCVAATQQEVMFDAPNEQVQYDDPGCEHFNVHEEDEDVC